MNFYREESNIFVRTLDTIAMIFVVIALAWFSVFSFGKQITNTGQSMQPVLLSGEHALMDRLKYGVTGPSRYDVVVFRSIDGRTNIKRIIGPPGETVQIQGGKVYIDGEQRGGKYGDASLSGLASSGVFLGRDEYFVLGDNRESSEDSRFDSIGNVKRKDIVGKVWLRIGKISRFGFIH